MKKDIDMELYNDYIKNDETKAFEILYIKYRDKIKYFIYNIIGDYDKAEDITQETFTYILQNKIKNNYSFKFHLVWNDFMNEVIKGQIEFVDGYSELANELNKQSFTAEELSEESYYKIYGKSSLKLKQQIKKRN